MWCLTIVHAGAMLGEPRTLKPYEPYRDYEVHAGPVLAAATAAKA